MPSAPARAPYNALPICKAAYDALVRENLGGVYPHVVEAPKERHTPVKPRRFPCEHAGCEHVATCKASLRRHMANRHGVGTQSHPCDQPGCAYVAKWANSLKQHKQKAHGIDVNWHRCRVEGCAYKAKTTVGLREHEANVHDINVVWHWCQVPGCKFKAKQRRNVLQHAGYMHTGREVTKQWRVDVNRAREDLGDDSASTCSSEEGLDVDGEDDVCDGSDGDEDLPLRWPPAQQPLACVPCRGA